MLSAASPPHAPGSPRAAMYTRLLASARSPRPRPAGPSARPHALVASLCPPHSPHAARTARHAHPLGVSPADGVSPSSQLRWPTRRRPCSNLAATPRVALTPSGAPSSAPNSAPVSTAGGVPPLVTRRPSRGEAPPLSRAAAAPSSRASAMPPSGASAAPPSGASATPPSGASVTPPSGPAAATPAGPSAIPPARVAGLSNTAARGGVGGVAHGEGIGKASGKTEDLLGDATAAHLVLCSADHRGRQCSATQCA